jgi:hypothetical protein
MALVAWELAALIAQSPLGQADPGLKNVFYRLYGLHEGPHFLVLAAFMVGAAWYLTGPRPSLDRHHLRRPRGRALVLGVTVFIVLGSVLGHRWVMHSYPLSMDEFNAEFQSRIFETGHLSASVPEPWPAQAALITPGFITYDEVDHSWRSAYLPVYAALRAMALKFSAASMLNPLLAAASLLCIAAVSRRLWPSVPAAPVLAVLMLASSSQFLATSMTAYSMPAHLCLNLLWLGLYLNVKDDGVGWQTLLLPWIGVLALGLHNPFPHALFVAPFLLRFARSRRAGAVIYVGAVYLVGCMVWATWLGHSLTPAARAHAAGLFGLPGLVDLVTEVMSLSLILSWQTPVMALGIALMMAGTRRMRPFERDLLAGIVLTAAFYVAFRASQGHGWGYRYIYNVLGSLVLLAVAGIMEIRSRCGSIRMERLVAASLLVTVAFQWPLRGRQIERFVRPFAAASRFIRDGGGAAVVVPTARIWYGSDLIRNDPELSSPVLVARSHSNPGEQRRWLAKHVGGGVRDVDVGILGGMGLVVGVEEGQR